MKRLQISTVIFLENLRMSVDLKQITNNFYQPSSTSDFLKLSAAGINPRFRFTDWQLLPQQCNHLHAIKCNPHSNVVSDCGKLLLSENFTDGMGSRQIGDEISLFSVIVANVCEFIYQGTLNRPCSSSRLHGGDLWPILARWLWNIFKHL